MNAKRLIISSLVGVAFASLTWLIFGNHLPYARHVGRGLEYLGWAITTVSLPGLITAMVASGNVHGGNIVIASLGNFLFYFGTTYFFLAIREKRKAKSLGLTETPQDGGS